MDPDETTYAAHGKIEAKFRVRMAKLFTLKAESKLQQPATGRFKIKTQLCQTVAGRQNKTVFPEPLGFSIRLLGGA